MGNGTSSIAAKAKTTTGLTSTTTCRAAAKRRCDLSRALFTNCLKQELSEEVCRHLPSPLRTPTGRRYVCCASLGIGNLPSATVVGGRVGGSGIGGYYVVALGPAVRPGGELVSAPP